MEVRRTAPVKLAVSDDELDAFHETADQFLHCANVASAFCWNDDSFTKCVVSKAKAERALYVDLKAETDLTANLVQKAIRRAVEAVKSGVDRWKKGKRVSQPHFNSWSVVYDKRSATFYRNHASLSTVVGRIDCEFVLPSGSPTPYERYVLPEEFEFRMATLQYDRATDALYLHIGTRAYEPENNGNESEGTDDTADTENHSVLGVDLGVENLAVASTGRFWSAGKFNHRRREFEKRRGGMQQRGTQAAHNAMQRLGDREEAWYKQHLHTIANELVAEAVEHDCDIIVFEDLSDIRENIPYAKWQHVWAFQRLYDYVEYKAAMHDVRTKQVPLNHTSQRCSKCGFTTEANRDGERFECRSCGYELHADYNASKNIGLRYVRRENHRLRSGQKSPGGDAQVDVRVHGGTLNDDGPTALAAD